LADYLVVNVSSPTRRLRRLQDPAALQASEDVQAECRSQEAKEPAELGAGQARSDLEQAEVQGTVEAALAYVDGIIATNTTLRREALSRRREEAGGLSGRLSEPVHANLSR
jgi:dihydroorotate dehydrogenase